MQRQMAGLKNGPHAHGKGLPAGVALVQAEAGGLAPHCAGLADNAAMGAYPAIRPQVRLDVGKGGCLGLELGGVQDGLGHGPGFLDYPQTLPEGYGYVKCNIAIKEAVLHFPYPAPRSGPCAQFYWASAQAGVRYAARFEGRMSRILTAALFVFTLSVPALAGALFPRGKTPAFP